MNLFYKKIIKKIIRNNKTISISESCTGGKISDEFCKIPGVSKVFLTGIIAYSNDSKIKFLKINKNRLKKYGAVSKQIASDMAHNLLKISNSDYSISTTGIAGPTGKTKNKSIGLVYIGFASKKKIKVYKKQFNGRRIAIQKKATNFVFKILNKNLV